LCHWIVIENDAELDETSIGRVCGTIMA